MRNDKNRITRDILDGNIQNISLKRKRRLSLTIDGGLNIEVSSRRW